MNILDDQLLCKSSFDFNPAFPKGFHHEKGKVHLITMALHCKFIGYEKLICTVAVRLVAFLFLKISNISACLHPPPKETSQESHVFSLWYTEDSDISLTSFWENQAQTLLIYAVCHCNCYLYSWSEPLLHLF